MPGRGVGCDPVWGNMFRAFWTSSLLVERKANCVWRGESSRAVDCSFGQSHFGKRVSSGDLDSSEFSEMWMTGEQVGFLCEMLGLELCKKAEFVCDVVSD